MLSDQLLLHQHFYQSNSRSLMSVVRWVDLHNLAQAVFLFKQPSKSQSDTQTCFCKKKKSCIIFYSPQHVASFILRDLLRHDLNITVPLFSFIFKLRSVVVDVRFYFLGDRSQIFMQSLCPIIRFPFSSQRTNTLCLAMLALNPH